MCGIFGYVARDGQPIPVERCRRLTNLLRHRGPDEGGYWHDQTVFLGHRRLAVIDPGHAHQPMASPDGRLVIVFNGEIYNYIELRAELRQFGHEFRTASDTEVLLAGYAQWGTDVARRLVGMFAFAIFDRRERTLYLARDRMGEKPLLYRDADQTLIFASELSPIAAAMTGSRELDLQALGSYLCLNYVAGDRTLLRGVRRLKPGTWRIYRDGGPQADATYWTPSESLGRQSVPQSHEARVAELQERVDRAVALALRSDVPVGLFLSGGIDSTVVAESAARQGLLKRAFCVDMQEVGFSEWPMARLVAARLEIELVRVPFGATVLEHFLELVDHADDPLADSSALPVWTVSQAAARDLKVVLSGDGGDELFGGYLTYIASRAHAVLASILPPGLRASLAAMGARLPVNDRRKVSPSYKLHRFLRACHLPTREAHFTWNGTWMPAEAASLLRDEIAADRARHALEVLADAHGLSDPPPTSALQCADISDYLANDILVKVDRMTMAHGLESRAPLLNPELADFALSLPDDQKVGRRGQTKVLLRSLCERRFGPEIARAKKKGFSIPIHQWLRGPGRVWLSDLLSKQAVDDLGVFDASRVAAAVEAHLAGRRALGWELWGLMVLSAWFRRRVSNPPDPDRLPDPSDLVEVTARTAV